MKACFVEKNDTLLWKEVPTPTAGEGEALIKVHAFGVNRADLLQRAGNYPPPPGCPEWMGLEIAGEVADIRDPSCGFKVGDRICALLGGGGYAEYALVKTDMLMRLPDNFSYVQGAAIPETYATSYLDLFREGKLQTGETYLVFAGASGIGIASTQIAKSVGARVVATVRSDEKAELIKKYGADRVVNSKKENLKKVFEEESPDVVIDCVGGPEAGELITRMNRGGRWVSIATLGGAQTTIDMNTYFKRGLHLIGSTLRSRTPQMKAEICSELVEKIFPGFADGRFAPVIHQVFPAADVEGAHTAMRENRNIGKLIVSFDEE